MIVWLLRELQIINNFQVFSHPIQLGIRLNCFDERLFIVNLLVMKGRIDTFRVDGFSVNFQEIKVSISHQIYNAIAKGLKVIFSWLIRILMSPNRSVLHSSKKWPLLLFDVNALCIHKWDGSPKVCDIDLSILDSEVGGLYISVQLTESVILLNCVEHLYWNFKDHLVFLFTPFRIHQVFNTMRQVSHNKESTTFVKGVHDIFWNFGS